MKVPGPVGACTHTTRVLSHYSLLLHTPLRSWHGGVLKLAACPRYPRYPLHHWLLCHSLHIHTFSRTRKCARCVCARCARFGDRTVLFLVRSGDRTVLFLFLYPLQGCTICRLVSLARPRRLAEPDLVQNSIEAPPDLSCLLPWDPSVKIYSMSELSDSAQYRNS